MSVVAAQKLFVTVIVSDVQPPRLAVELVITPVWLFIVTALATAVAVPLFTFEITALLKSIAVFEALKEFTVRVMAKASSKNERRIC